MNRKTFFRHSMLSGSAFILAPLASHAIGNLQVEPQLDKELVKEFVNLSHRDMDAVKSMLEEHPTLLNAAHDWKYGDFETGLGASQHVGYKELASYFIEHGAQADIFTLALFGQIEILKPFLIAYPAALNARGPHGYTLLHHANKGEEDALEVKEYLLALGAVETKYPLY